VRVPRVDVRGVELDLPEALEAQHVLEPERDVAERREVRGGVVEADEAEAVLAAARLVVGHEAGEEVAVPAALDEAEGGVAEGAW
jgi:hypothetical protein